MRKGAVVVLVVLVLVVVLVRSNCKSTVTDSCTACQAPRVQIRREALTSVNPTLELRTGLQSAKVSALEDTQHHSNWSQGAHQVDVVPLAQAIGLPHTHQHCLGGRWCGQCLM